MRVAVQAMLVQHGDAQDNTIALFPAWPCDEWSVEFKVHLPQRTILHAKYDHVMRTLVIVELNQTRRGDLRFMGCVNASSGVRFA
jgi:hypothetical protein